MSDDQLFSPLGFRERMHRAATRVASVMRTFGESAFELVFFWRH